MCSKWKRQLWLRPDVTDIPFSKARNFSKLSYPVLAGYDSPVLSIYGYSVTLSVVEAWAFLYPKASSAKKKGSRWSVFGAQHSLGNRSVLPGAIVSPYHRTLS